MVMLSVVSDECHKQTHYAEYHYAECHYAECHYAECRYEEYLGACYKFGHTWKCIKGQTYVSIIGWVSLASL